MNPKQKVRLATSKLPPGVQREVDELQRVFTCTQKYLKGLPVAEKSSNLSSQVRKEGNNLLMQKGHDVKTHRQILKWYSHCIEFAPQGSEELVLGYGNRSALLMHLQHYEEALVDINKALQLSKSDDYKKKLQARKEKCSGLLDEQNLIESTKYLSLAENKELVKIRPKVETFKPSDTVACAADCVGIAYNDQFGRHLVATRDINPGEIIIVERGYASTPILSELHLVCSHCSQYAWNGIPCNHCVYAIYCSEDCKKEAREEYHDIECPILKYMHPIVFNSNNGIPVFVAIRVLITALRKEGFESIMKEISKERNEESFESLLSHGVLKSDFKACYNLSPWIKDTGKEYEELEYQISQILYLLINYTDFLALIGKNSASDKATVNLLQPIFHDDDDDTTVVDPCMLLKFKEALMRLKSIASTNVYPIQTGVSQCRNCKGVDEHLKICQLKRGHAIVPCFSLISHSCTSNVSYLSAAKRKFVAYSTCPIKKGEMLCASYRSISILQGDVKTRETMLKNFICKCRACLEKIDIMAVANGGQRDLNKIQVEIKKKMSASVAESYFQRSYDDREISQKTFQEMIKISQILYKHFNYYKAFAHAAKCNNYICATMGKLHRDKISMPNDC